VAGGKHKVGYIDKNRKIYLETDKIIDMNTFREEWQFRCPKCNFSKTFSEAGGGAIRVGSSRGKRTLGWCPDCKWFRFLIVEFVKVEERPASSDR
jgi:hypothetical protein